MASAKRDIRHIIDSFSEDLILIAQEIARVADEFQMPASIVHKNPGISPLALNSLLSYFRETDNSPEDLIPVHPSSEDAVDSYVRIFGRIQKTLGGRLAPVRPVGFWRALMIVEWMKFDLAKFAHMIAQAAFSEVKHAECNARDGLTMRRRQMNQIF